MFPETVLARRHFAKRNAAGDLTLWTRKTSEPKPLGCFHLGT